MGRWLLAVGIVAAVAACGGKAEDAGAEAASLATFRAGVERVDAAATAYGAAAGMADAHGCVALHRRYDADVRPVLEHLREMAAWMDERVAERCDPDHADVRCGADAMCAELDRHASAACASAGDLGANAAEAAAHVRAMHDWAEHQRARAGELDGAMSGHGAPHHMGGSGTFTCTP